MIEQRILNDLGLTNIEAKTYMAILELGTDTVQNIAKKAEVKRPSCYLTLDSLQNQGLVTKIEKQINIRYFIIVCMKKKAFFKRKILEVNSGQYNI